MSKKQDQAHLAAIPILIEPLKRAIKDNKSITWSEAAQILRDWDKARSS